MARLNTRPSVVSSRTSRYASATPAPPSDQENLDPTQAQRDKGGRRTMDDETPSNMPTPSPTEAYNSRDRGQKRKRITVPIPVAEEAQEVDEDDEERRFNRYFDPNQDFEDRREIKKASRALDRRFYDSRDEFLRDNGRGLTDTVIEADDIFERVKQTNDATLDSRLLVNVSDLAYKKTSALVLGDTSTGVDVDEFLSKCLTYMRNGGPATTSTMAGQSSSRNRQNPTADEDGDEDAEGALDWAFLGRNACFPYNVRPPVPSFLLGPLSVEKKQRTQTQRRARQGRDTNAREARPEALTKEDLTQSDQNSLTAQCEKIRRHLRHHIKVASTALTQAGITTQEEAAGKRGRALFRKHRLCLAGGRPGPSLFEYVINPHSFGQTIENLFYVSFLIKEGSAGVGFDDQDLPVLISTSPHTLEQQREKNISKHQAVFSLDYSTWQALIQAFEIHEPMIPHREEEAATQLGSRGWYN